MSLLDRYVFLVDSEPLTIYLNQTWHKASLANKSSFKFLQMKGRTLLHRKIKGKHIDHDFKKSSLEPISQIQLCMAQSLVHLYGLSPCTRIVSHQRIFTILLLSPLGEGDAPVFENTFKKIHPNMLPAKYGWNWPSDSGEEDKNVNSLY